MNNLFPSTQIECQFALSRLLVFRKGEFLFALFYIIVILGLGLTAEVYENAETYYVCGA
jgi:hypothetical protein